MDHICTRSFVDGCCPKALAKAAAYFLLKYFSVAWVYFFSTQFLTFDIEDARGNANHHPGYGYCF